MLITAGSCVCGEITRVRNARNIGQLIEDTLIPLVVNWHCDDFDLIDIVHSLVHDLTKFEKPRYRKIRRAFWKCFGAYYNELPVLIYLDLDLLRYADRNNTDLLRKVWLASTMVALEDIGEKYGLPIDKLKAERAKYGTIPKCIADVDQMWGEKLDIWGNRMTAESAAAGAVPRNTLLEEIGPQKKDPEDGNEGPMDSTLYKKGVRWYYFDTWYEDDIHAIIYHGVVGKEGKAVRYTSDDRTILEKEVQVEIKKYVKKGYHTCLTYDTLLVEYSITGDCGTEEELAKRLRLQEFLGDFLSLRGLGMCDGGSIGSGTMEVCCFVVEYTLAERLIANALKGTEFENYTRIYLE
jgi:hypothetical protein